MIMTGSMTRLVTGQAVVLLDAWSTGGIPLMDTDGTVHWLSTWGDVECEPGDPRLIITVEGPDRERLIHIYELFLRWQDCERVGRVHRDPDDKRVVRFTPFKRYLEER